jgi:general secretion pathway protein K
LAAIAFSLANTVRGEAERASTAADGARAYYMAVGGIQRTALHVMWARSNPNQPQFRPTTPSLDVLPFPGGEVRVEIIPETAKLNINAAKPEELFRVLMYLGVDPGRANEITRAIVDWRTPGVESTTGPFDHYYLSMTPSFRARRASFEETEELLLLKGMTPDIYYGTYERNGGATDAPTALQPRGGLQECLSVFGTAAMVDANTAQPAVMAALGVTPDAIAAVLERRRVAPFLNEGELDGFLMGNPSRQRLRVGGNTAYTLRATARLRLPGGKLSDLRRSVAATVKFKPPGYGDSYEVLRWYDMAWGPGL